MSNNENFVSMLKKKYPEINVGKFIEIFERKHKGISGSENPLLPLDCDLNKHLCISVMSELIDSKNEAP